MYTNNYMRAQVLQESLSKAIGVAARFTAARAQLPVLGNILISAGTNKLTLSATNLEMSTALTIGAKVDEVGEVTVPARTINDVVNNLKTGQIDLISEKEELKIKAGGFSLKLAGMNTADFPMVPKHVGKEAAIISREAIADALAKTLFAVSSDETRPAITGIKFAFTKTGLTLAATDGFRLSEKKLRLEKSLDGEVFILPKAPLSEIMKLSGDVSELKLSVDKEDKQVVCALENIIIASRVIEGSFPDYHKIIPTEIVFKITIDREDLLQAVKLSAVFARDAANVVKIKVLKNELVLSAEGSNSGSQEGSVEAKVEKTGNVETLEIAYNCRFLEDFLQVVKADTIEINFAGSNLPGIFKDPSDPSFLHLIMPVKI